MRNTRKSRPHLSERASDWVATLLNSLAIRCRSDGEIIFSCLLLKTMKGVLGKVKVTEWTGGRALGSHAKVLGSILIWEKWLWDDFFTHSHSMHSFAAQIFRRRMGFVKNNENNFPP